jgi:uncharacterized membrane protein
VISVAVCLMMDLVWFELANTRMMRRRR